MATARRACRMPGAYLAGSHRGAGDLPGASRAGSDGVEIVCVERSGTRGHARAGRRCGPSPGADRTKAGQRAADVVSFFDLAAFFRLSDVWAPNFFVNRSTRPSVSMSFWRPVKNGWQFEQISRWSSCFVEWVFQVAPQA